VTPGLALPDLGPALPEMVLAVAAMALLILGVWRGEGSTRLVSWLAIGVLIIILVIAELGGSDRRVGFYGMFVNDAFALFTKALVLIGSAVTILMGMRYNEEQGIARFEFPVLVLLATTGMMVMIGQRPDLPLCRPRAAKSGALCRRCFQPRFGAVE